MPMTIIKVIGRLIQNHLLVLFISFRFQFLISLITMVICHLPEMIQRNSIAQSVVGSKTQMT